MDAEVIIAVLYIISMFPLIFSVMAFSAKPLRKVFIIAGEILIAISTPIAVFWVFYLLFPEYYKSGFLPGLAQLFIAMIVIYVNTAVTFPVVNLLNNQRVRQNKQSLLLRFVLLLIISTVVLQSIIFFIVEDPTSKSPSLNFL